MMGVLPMNLDYFITNEFGELEITNDTNKGIPTSVVARFRFGLDFDGSKVAAAKYLVPNIREFNPNADGTAHGYSDDIEYKEGMLATYQFSDVFEDYIHVVPSYTGVTLSPTNYGPAEKENKRDLMLGTNNNNIPEDYFYKFVYGKVYTVSSFQGAHFEGSRRDAFLGIKQIRPTADEDCASKANYFPTNFGYRNRTKFMLIVSQVLLFIQYIFGVIFVKVGELLGKFFYGIYRFFYGLGIGGWRPFRGFSQQLEDLAYRIQDRFTQQLPLTIYPDCEECTTSDIAVVSDTSYADSYCRLAEVKLQVYLPIIFGTIIRFRTPYSPSSDNFRNSITDSTFLTGTTETSNFFGTGNTETARDSDGPCTGATALDFSSLLGLSTLTTVIDGSTVPRYAVEIYGWANVTGNTIISEYVSELWNPPENPEQTYFQHIGGDLVIQYSNDIFEDLTGINITIAPADPQAPIFTDTYIVVRIYDRSLPKVLISTITGTTDLQIEEGCDKYDKVYNESMQLGFIWSTGQTSYGSPYWPINPNPGIYLEDNTYMESPTPDATHINLLSTVIADSYGVLRMPRYKPFTRIGRAYYDRKTKSGYSEFRDGVFTIIPVIHGRSNNFPAIQEWYRRKRVGLFFCGGVINYSFIDNWLNGILYFFKFEKRVRWDNEGAFDLNQRRTKYPRELVFFNILDNNFYYRCTPYQVLSGFTGQLYESNTLEILHPTTFYDVGVRDEFLAEICYDPMVDPECSVIRDIGPTSYQDAANIVEYAINYRMDITNSKFDVDDFFTGQPVTEVHTRIKVLDGDITQLISINCEAGIEGFDLDTPHYNMYNGELLDPEDPRFGVFFKDAFGAYAPISIDLKLDLNGVLIRSCLNNRLGDFSQIVPFYLWNKGREGFGLYGTYSDSQTWDRLAIASMKLQRIFSISGVTSTVTNYLMPDGEEEYLLKPMTIDHPTFAFTGGTEDMLERFEVISYDIPDTSPDGAIDYVEGDLWLYVPPTSGTTKDPQGGIIYVVVNKQWVAQPDPYLEGIREMFIPQTALNYADIRQVLSTPFLFYFGLRPEKTALDLLIKYFGPKGAFTTPTPIPLTEITPTPPPPTSPMPTPSISTTPGLPPSPSVTPTPSTSSAFLGYPIIYVANKSSKSYRIDNVKVQSLSVVLSPTLPYASGVNGSGNSPYGAGTYTISVTITGTGTIGSNVHITDSVSTDRCGSFSPLAGGTVIISGVVMNTSTPINIELNDFAC
jgi:hypothetical protein